MFFGLANGPLLGAIVLCVESSTVYLPYLRWQNRLVFHDIDKTTSLFIHLMPALLSYCVRWCNPEMWDNSTPEENTITFKDLGIMMLFYTLWQVCAFL